VCTNEIIEESIYYPFGLEHKGYNNVVNGREHPYKYNGMEHQEELGLDMYDYGARNYDPSLGRFFNVDPLGGSSSQIDKSSYAYAWNNPINMIDPDGMHAERSDEQTKARNLKRHREALHYTDLGAGASIMGYFGNGTTGVVKEIAGKSEGSKAKSTAQEGDEVNEGDSDSVLLPEVVVKSAKSAIRDIYISILGTKFYDDYYPLRNIKPAIMRQSDYNWANAWSDSDNFLANFSYSLSNDIYVTAQTLNPFDGQLTNIDGSGIVRGSSQHLDNGVNTLTTITPFVRGAALGGQTLKGLGYINRLNASQFSYTFKGNLARLSSKARGLTNRIFNKGIDFYNNQISGGMILFKLK